jgi:hypothetical protein
MAEETKNTAPIEEEKLSTGQQIAKDLSTFVEDLNKEIIKFFDKDIKVSGKRVNKGASELKIFAKDLRNLVKEKRTAA